MSNSNDQQQHNQPQQCIADIIELHVRNACDNMKHNFTERHDRTKEERQNYKQDQNYIRLGRYWGERFYYTYSSSIYPVSEKMKKIALLITHEIRGELFLVGRSSKGVAAGILYCAAMYGGECVTQVEIQDTLGVSYQSIHTLYKIIRKWINIHQSILDEIEKIADDDDKDKDEERRIEDMGGVGLGKSVTSG